jgi:hypothetical protein
MYDFIKSLIAAGGYRLDAMEKTIERHYVRGDLTDVQRVELLQLAADHADESKEIDVVSVLADLERRIEVLESAGVVVWKQGMSVAKGQTVLYPILKPADTTLRYCRYDGGRSATALSPGKIDGWVILSGAGGAVTHKVEKDSECNIILVPVNAE